MKVETGVFKRGVSPSSNILLPFGKDKGGEVIKYFLPTHPPGIVFDYASWPDFYCLRYLSMLYSDILFLDVEASGEES